MRRSTKENEREVEGIERENVFLEFSSLILEH
jgi:hypothetical protein